MPLLNLPPAEVRRRRRFVIVFFEVIAVFATIFNFVLFRHVLTSLSLTMVLAIVAMTFLLVQAILFFTLYLLVGPNRSLD